MRGRVMEICVDEYGYIYILEPSGAKRYILVDMPNCHHYGKLKLGDPIIEADERTDLRDFGEEICGCHQNEDN